MPINVYESPDFDLLWQQFESTLDVPLASPLALEWVVVPGRGWESAFGRRLAEARGCWAQFKFLPFGLWVAEVLEQVLGSKLAPKRELDSLTWAVAKRLPQFANEPDFRGVRDYLFSEPGELDPQRLIELSRCIGRLLDRYLLERPDLIDAWEQGRDWPVTADNSDVPPAARWQRRLWTSITKTQRYRSVRTMSGDLDRLLNDRDGASSSRLPERVSVWICGGISPSLLSFLEAVGRQTEIALFVLVPVAEYWGDMRGRRALLRKRRDSTVSLREFCRIEMLDLLHPLLASLGELSRQQQMLMVDCDTDPWQPQEVGDWGDGIYSPRPGTPGRGEQEGPSLLASLQSDIRLAVEPEKRELPRDDSLRIHNCHSAIREVEVLQAQLRAAFEADHSLTPEDVAVFCPDLETYAPLVQAVFGLTEPHAPGHIPFQLAGRSPRRTRPMFEAYVRVLDVLQGRFGVSEIIDLLHIEPVGKAAGFDREDIERIADWAIESGIRWGADAEHRVAAGLPETDLNTWEFGINRLLLGYAMPPGGDMLVGDIVAIDRAAGLSGVTLGRLWVFLRRLREWRERVQQARSLADWQPLFGQLAQQLMDFSDDEGGLQKLLGAIAHVGQLAAENGFHLPLPFNVAVREILREIDESASGAPFRAGGVTFCDLASLRSLPFRVIGLIGMSDGEFPRRQEPVQFDLVARQPQVGDRTPRLEDRHLFLEALLAAREQLIITYRGQSIRDQRLRPPSIVVEELLDALDQTDEPEDGQTKLRDFVVVKHPLHAFSPRYFDGSDERLFSDAPDALQAAERLLGSPSDPPQFADQVLPFEADLQEVTTDELRLVLTAPWKLFLRRLKVSLGDDVEDVDLHEPLLLSNLDRWAIGDRWLRERLADVSNEQLTQRFARSGSVPAGPLGRETTESFWNEAEELLIKARKAGVSAHSEPLRVALRIDLPQGFSGDADESREVRLIGVIADWTTDGIRRVSWSKLGTRRMLALWFDHLVATVATNRPCETSVLVCRDENFELRPIEPSEALIELRQLVGLYALARCTPLPFFPSCIVPKTLTKGPLDFSADDVRGKLMRDAQQGFFEGLPPVEEDSSVRAAFAGQSPLTMRCDRIPSLQDAGRSNLFLHLTRLLIGRLL